MADDPSGEPERGRAESTQQLWRELRLDPVEIALPGGVGYTLRAYRSNTELEELEFERGEPDLDDFDAAASAVARRRRPQLVDEDGEPIDDETRAAEADDEDEDEDEDELDEELGEDELAAALDEDDETPVEDVPVFLAHKGKVLLFHNPEKLVEFLHSDAPNDLRQLDTWQELVTRVTADDIVAADEDSYELDLVVENLRGGADAWDTSLILKAGEVARDLGYALRLDSVVNAMAPGSPLDDLDEALRAAENGGVGGFLAKRKLRKIPAQQTSLAWRTVIGKIAAATDWRD